MIDTSLPFRTGAGLSVSELREVDGLLADGLLVHVLFDVVVAADTPAHRPFRAHAVRLVVPDRLRERGAVVAQEAAAWVWCGGPPPRAIDLAVPPGRGRTVAPHLMLHERLTPPVDVTAVEATEGPPLSLTTGARTATDLLRLLPVPDALEAALTVAAVLGVTPADVMTCLARMPRARGVARARRHLRDWPVPGDLPATGQSIRFPVTR